MNKLAKATVGTAAAATGLGLLLGDVIYEVVLNRHFTSWKNNQRMVTEDLFEHYDPPEAQTESDAWFVANRPKAQELHLMNGETLYAYFFMQKEYTEKWAFVIHGYTSCPRAQADQALYFYREMGYNVIMPCLRSFDQDKHTYCTMGDTDKYYVVEWINYVVNKDPNAKIVILGVSMGSATTMLTTGEDLPDNVKCAVADCGYTSVWDEFAAECKAVVGLPSFPFVNLANTVSKLRGRFDFRKVSPLEAVARSKTPTLFIHGEEDRFVPYWMLDKVYDACIAEKEKLSIPDAGHAESQELHPELYYPAVDKFVRKYMDA